MAVAITRTADPTSIAGSGLVTTYSSVAIGTATADRILVVNIHIESSSVALSSITVDYGLGPREMIPSGFALFGSVVINQRYLHAPSGTTATIALTWTPALALAAEHHINVYTVTGAGNAQAPTVFTATSTDMDVTSPLSVSVTIPTNGGGIAAVSSAAATAATKTWASFTEDLDLATANFGYSTATKVTSGTATLTCTGTTNLEDGAMSVLVFAPGTVSTATTHISTDVPRPSEYPLFLRTWSTDPLSPFPPFTAAAVTYMPGRVLNWGRALPIDFPIGLRTWTESAQQAPPNLPFAQYDWPVQVAPAYSISLRTFIAINPPLLATSPPPPILMPPLIVEWGVSDRTTFEPARIQYNAPLLTAPVTVTKPFVQADWPVPPAPQRAANLRTFINDTPIQLIGKDALPVRQQNWLVPIAPDYSVSLRSFLARPGLPLISAPVQPPFSQDDWPLPIAAIQPIRTWTQSPTIATPVVAPTFMPGRVSDWGMWDRVPFSAAPISNLTLSLPVAVAVTYVFREPYYSPQWAGPRFETWTTSVNLALRAVPPPQRPFTQTDWPLTPAARQPDRTFQRAFPPELIGQDRLPVRQKDWPLPVPVAPVNDLRTFIGPPQKQPVVLPFRQSDWPVPIATDFSNALRSIGFRSPALDVVAGRPFVQSDWPVPAAARQPDRTFQRSFPPALVGKDRLPIRQQDWPLPIAPRPAADLRTYIAQSPIRLIGKDRLPFRQMHWPVPLAPLEFHTLRSITQGRVIYGGEVAPIPPEPPLPPPEVIHSVRAHADAYYGVSYFDEIKGRADFSRAKGSNDEEAAN